MEDVRESRYPSRTQYDTRNKTGLMNVLSKIFGREEVLTPAKRFDLGDLSRFYESIVYEKYYAEALKDVEDLESAIEELFIFRAWATQYAAKVVHDPAPALVGNGFRERAIAEGKRRFVYSRRSSFKIRLEQRWRSYDRIASQTRFKQAVPTGFVCAQLVDYCGILDSDAFVWLCLDLEFLLDKIGSALELTLDNRKEGVVE